MHKQQNCGHTLRLSIAEPHKTPMTDLSWCENSPWVLFSMLNSFSFNFISGQEKKDKDTIRTRDSRCEFAYFFIQGLRMWFPFWWGVLSSHLACGMCCPTICHTIRSACLGDRDSSCYVVKCKLSYQLETLTAGDFSEHLSRACQHPVTTESMVMHPPLCPGRVSLEDMLVKSPKLEMAEGISYSSNFWMVLWRKQCLEKKDFTTRCRFWQ